MDPLWIALGLTFMASLWFVPIGAIRLMAFRSGEVDHTRGMQKVARTILTIGLVSFGIFLILAAIALTRG